MNKCNWETIKEMEYNGKYFFWYKTECGQKYYGFTNGLCPHCNKQTNHLELIRKIV